MFFGRRMGGASRKPASWLVAMVLACFVLSLAPVGSLQPAWADPTPPSPVAISTPAELDAVRNDLGGFYVLTSDIDLAASGDPWVPIGSDAAAFSGTLEGNGFAVMGLRIDDISGDHQGLFGKTGPTAEIRNLGVVGVSIDGGQYVGGLAGQNYGTIRNCYTTGDIRTGDETTLDMFVGGLVGTNWGPVSTSYSEVNITGQNAGGGGYGGLVGDNSMGGSITDCYSRGSVSAAGDVIGGLVGTNTGWITRSYTTASVTYAGTEYGGLVGRVGDDPQTVDSFWDTEVFPDGSAGGTGKTTAEMTDVSTYTGAFWDFDATWTIDGAVNDGYPTLQLPAAPVIGEADLAFLHATPGFWHPAFASDVYEYWLDVEEGTGSIDITAYLADAAATLEIQGDVHASGVPKTVPLVYDEDGFMRIEIDVTDPDGIITHTYTIHVMEMGMGHHDPYFSVLPGPGDLPEGYPSGTLITLFDDGVGTWAPGDDLSVHLLLTNYMYVADDGLNFNDKISNVSIETGQITFDLAAGLTSGAYLIEVRDAAEMPVAQGILAVGEILDVEDMDGHAPMDLIAAILDNDTIPLSSVTDVSFSGTDVSAGFFTGPVGIVGFDAGIILSTGSVHNVPGPNTQDGITHVNSLPGDADLDALIPGYTTQDATILEFSFVPTQSILTFEYVFASEEYPEFVGSDFNDVFGFFVNGVNVATIPYTDSVPVSINNVNEGMNSQFFRPNYVGTNEVNIEMDGLTTVMTVSVGVTPDVPNTIKLAIADAGDLILDSNVFIRAAGFEAIAPVPVTGIEITDGDFSLDIGDTWPLTAEIAPGDATNTNVTWSSSASGTVSVSPSGLATAHMPGVATITATTQDGSFSDSVEITAEGLPAGTQHIVVGLTDGGTVTGYNWTPGATATVTVDRGGVPVLSDTVNAEGRFEVHYRNEADRPVSGDLVTVNDGSLGQAHTVRNLVVMEADPDTDIVTGMADPESAVEVTVFTGAPWDDLPRRTVQAAGSGVWSADFTGLYSLQPGDTGQAAQYDPEGNSTAFYWGIPDTYFEVYPEEDWIRGLDFAPNSAVTVTIGETEHDGITTNEFGYFDLSVPVGHHDMVTVEDTVQQKNHMVHPLLLSDVQRDIGLVGGTATGGSEITVRLEAPPEGYGPPSIKAEETVTADGEGAWSVSFGRPIEEHEIVYAFWQDADGDRTVYRDVGMGAGGPLFFVVIHPDPSIEGSGWEPDDSVQVTVTRDDALVYTADADTDESGNFEVELRNESFAPMVGDRVEVAQDSIQSSHIVQEIWVTDVDAATNTVTGFAAPNTDVEVSVFTDGPWPSVTVQALESGVWTADFTGLYDLQLDDYGEAVRYDEQGNGTLLYWSAAIPTIDVFPEDDQIQGYSWAPDVPMTVTVGATVYDGFSTDSHGYFSLESAPTQPGQTVTATDGVDTKTHVVTPLAITDVDRPGGVVSGTTAGGTWVTVEVLAASAGYGPPEVVDEETVQADVTTGEWSVAFAGGIAPDETIYAYQEDEDGDRTSLVRPGTADEGGAYLIVNHQSNSIWGHASGPVSLVIDDSGGDRQFTSEPTATESGGYYEFMDIAYDIQPGDLITLTDSQGTITHTVQDLWIDDVDLGTNRVEGRANGNTTVEVRVNRHGPDPLAVRTVLADEDGLWMADFGVAGPGEGEDPYDLEDGDSIDAMVWIDGNATLAHWEPAQVEQPQFVVDPYSNALWGHGWDPDSHVWVVVNDKLEAEKYRAPFPTNEWGHFSTEDMLERDGVDLLVGETVTVSQVETEKTHTIQYVFVHMVDSSGVVKGWADPDTELFVETYEATDVMPGRVVVADGMGNDAGSKEWIADFTQAGDGDCPCEAIVYAPFVLGTEGAVRVTDADGDATQVYWQAGGALAGIVTDGAGDPVEGAKVWAQRNVSEQQWAGHREAATDLYGNYVIMGLETGDYRVEARAQGMVPQVYDGVLWYEDATLVYVMSPAQSGGIDFALEPGGSISGRVVDNEGEPVRWAQVYAAAGRSDGPQQDVGQAFTNANGEYILAGLPDGDIMVAVYADGYIRKMNPDTYVYENEMGVPIADAGEVTDVDFTLDPVVVRADSETAIGDGVAWLVSQQDANGSWGAHFPTAKTAFSLLVLGYDAFSADTTSLAADYTNQAEALDALEYLMSDAHEVDGTGMVHFSEAVDIPPFGTKDYRIYQTSIALMAIVSTQDPGHVVADFLNDGPWTLGEIAEAVVAYLEWAQGSDGGWSYGPAHETGRSDQSNAGWATLALAYAEAPEYGFAIPVSGIVRDRVDSWIDVIQVDESMVDPGDRNLGGARYTVAQGDVDANSLRTGNLLQQMAFVGDTAATPRVQDALDYLWRHWESEFGYGGQQTPSNYQAMYTVTKGLEAIGVELLGPVDLEIDWFAEFTSDIMHEHLWNGQWANGPYDRLEGAILSTQWALMTLQKATAPTLERADLAFQSVDVDPLGETWEGDYELRFTVINRGNVESPVGIDVRVYVDDVLAGTFLLPVMTPGMVSGEFSLSRTLSGTYDTIRLVIDEDETIEELRRDNNIKEFEWPRSITGQVRDAMTQAPIAGAIVEALDGANTVVTGGVTDATGYYALAGLPDGTYAVQASHLPQYGMQRIDGVAVVAPAETRDVDFELSGVGDARFVVSMEPDRVWGHHWPVGVELTILVGPVDDPLFGTTASVDAQGDFEVWLDDQPSYDGELMAGALVTVTDGVIAKQHVVTALAVTDVDHENDTISGTAEAGSWVSVHLYPGEPGHIGLDVQTDGAGQWQALFDPGAMDAEAFGFAVQTDNDGDQTFVFWTAADPVPTFYTVPASPVDVELGERFIVDIYLRDAYGIKGADFVLDFDPTLLQVVQNAHLGIFEVIGENVADNVAGEVRFAGSNADVQDFPDTRIYVIEFEAVALGDTELAFTNNELTDDDAQLVPAAGQGVAVRIYEGATVTGTVNRPGMADNSGVLVTVEGEGITALTQEDGSFTLTGVPLGTVRLIFTKDTYLVTIVTLEVTEFTEYVLDEMVSMRSGDINNDGVVNISDLTLLASAYRAALGDANYNPNADLNNDGVVNISDLTLLAGSYRQTNDE